MLLDPAAYEALPKPRKKRLDDIKAAIDVAEEREQCEAQLLTFLEHAWPYVDNSEFQSSWCLEAIADHLEAVTLGHIKRLLINVPPRCGKPVACDALVLTRRGLLRLDEIIVGDEVWTHKSRWRLVLAVHVQGELDVIKLMTRRGRVVEAAPDHPFLTPDGWVDLGKLQIDDVVGVVPCREDCGQATISAAEARLLGYLIGDGSCRGTPNVTCASDLIAADVMRCAGVLGFVGVQQRYALRTRRVSVTGGRGDFVRMALHGVHGEGKTKQGYLGPVKAWLSSRGLLGQNSYTKLVPDVVMQGNNEIVRQFLGAYWSCDGYISSRGAKRDGVERDDLAIGCDSVHRKLLEQIQILLCRIGINSTLRAKIANRKTKRQGDSYRSYSLMLSKQDDCWRFAQQIDLYHEKVIRLRTARARRFDFDQPLWGDVIVSLEPNGRKQCRCLSVDEDQSFTANGFAVHNTILCSIMHPAWTWARRTKSYLSGPQVKFLCASYSHTLSLDASNKSRRLLLSPWYQKLWPGQISFQQDQNAKHNFENTAGGARVATSVGGGLIGLGADLLLGDDLNNTEDVESEAERETVKTFWQEFHSTRLNDPNRSAVIVIQQRLHQNDVSGLWLESNEDVVHLCIPMKYDTSRSYVTVALPQYTDGEPYDDPRTEEGELMWPERFNEEAVQRLESLLGPFMAAGRLQQLPTPKGGGIIQDIWWQNWTAEAQSYGLEWNAAKDGLKEFPQMELVVGSIDTAYGEKEENDYSAMSVWGIWIDRGKNRRAMLMHAWNKRLPLHGKSVTIMKGEPEDVFKARKAKSLGLVETIAEECKRYKIQRLLIENKTRGVDVANELRRLYARDNWGIELTNPQKDKVTRTHSVVPMFTDNVVWAPNTQWAQNVIDNCSQFPKGTHDDLHDTVTQFLNWARENMLLARADEEEAIRVDEKTYRPVNIGVLDSYGLQ